jgi:hypothetical protein
MKKHRKEVVQFLKSEYQNTGKTPSILRICQGLRLSKKALYEAFPGRKSEMCAVAGIPVDKASLYAVEKASRALKEKRIKEAPDEELAFLKEQEDEMSAEVRRVKSKEDTKKRTKELAFQLASSPEGRERIFADPKWMLKFAEYTIDYESCASQESNVWDWFVGHCRSHGLDLAKTLFQVAGPLKEYEADTDEGGLHNYLGLKLEIFLTDCEEEEKQKVMQVKFDDLLRSSRCTFCGRRASDAFVEENELRCPCGNFKWVVWCPNCQQVLDYERENEGFYCNDCALLFKFCA